MFSTTGLFSSVPCPNKTQCKRVQCIFSHAPNAAQPVLPSIPVSAPVSGSSNPSSSRNTAASGSALSNRHHLTASVIPAKRSSGIKSYAKTPDTSQPLEPPKKFQKLGGAAFKQPAASTTIQTTGEPKLRINAALSKVAIPVRQAMLKTLYETFATLYSDILVYEPTLASKHALEQEQDVYDKSTKITYRNAIISSIAALRKRPKPNSILHESNVAYAYDKLRSLKLSSKHLSPYVMSIDELKRWGFMIRAPSDEGKIRQCEKLRVWSCCSQPAADSEGCGRGPHVFSESLPEELHAQHAFSHTRSADESPDTVDTALDVVALDCEMVYTTGGVRVARVSAVDGSGKEVFDELIKMDEGVHVIDFNTRFSGITDDEYKKALLSLNSIRRSLDAFINSNTIMIGHALDNDLRTLRMIHHRCVDTAILFPHRAGPPYRRALRELSRELLGRVIQTGSGTSGHSSVEDSVATLDLVRWFILNRTSAKKPVPSTT
ncbi:ribonuclease H-like domain-containing protein [Phellopilus nigrolimitatus]|nr:ribonuclease H-like domain-containing protein [Phellopilus nigrolimitatus]